MAEYRDTLQTMTSAPPSLIRASQLRHENQHLPEGEETEGSAQKAAHPIAYGILDWELHWGGWASILIGVLGLLAFAVKQDSWIFWECLAAFVTGAFCLLIYPRARDRLKQLYG